ncbi:MAG: lipase family protein [Gammaproteobacteria bacterium]|nr:lipase family protein [Gammaproteobacteria bacterium]
MINSHYPLNRDTVIHIAFIALTLITLFQSTNAYSDNRLIKINNAGNKDFNRILTFAQFANATYGADNLLTQLAKNNGYAISAIKIIDNSFVRFYVATNKSLKSQLVAIRGTSNIENALIDIDAQLVPHNTLGIKLHRGFAAAAGRISSELIKVLHKDYSIEFTGHSLGGAIAVILAMDLSRNGYNIGNVVTFGQPKVTNIFGARKFSKLHISRIVSDTDIVPLVPPVSFLDLANIDIYWHLGEEIVLFPGKYYSRLTGVKSMMRGLSFINKNFSEEDLYAHQMTTYLQLISDKLSTNTVIPYDEHQRHLGGGVLN